MGSPVGQNGGEVSDRGTVEYTAHVGVKHVCSFSGVAGGTSRYDSDD
jgi:hypothetical protein